MRTLTRSSIILTLSLIVFTFFFSRIEISSAYSAKNTSTPVFSTLTLQDPALEERLVASQIIPEPVLPTKKITPTPTTNKKNATLTTIDFEDPVEGTFTKQSGDPALWKVNKTISIGDYIPSDITTFQGVQMSERIIPDLTNLVNAAKADGIILKPTSGYRSYAYQAETFNYWLGLEMRKNPKLTLEQARIQANFYSAYPGHSEHQLGTTVDVLSAENNYKLSADKNLKYVGWMEANAKKFNFTISYPEGNGEYTYEPWHIRWRPSN